MNRQQWHDFWHPAELRPMHFVVLAVGMLVAGALALPVMLYVIVPLAKALQKLVN